jgi:hypothetical protein
VPSPVKYFQADEGGVSHFNYWRDNRLLTWMHIRLMFGFALRLPLLLYRHGCACRRSENACAENGWSGRGKTG